MGFLEPRAWQGFIQNLWHLCLLRKKKKEKMMQTYMTSQILGFIAAS